MRRLLTDTSTYSLTPGNLPSGRGFYGIFSNGKQERLLYFATAATLLLRNMGVPARYVEGI